MLLPNSICYKYNKAILIWILILMPDVMSLFGLSVAQLVVSLAATISVWGIGFTSSVIFHWVRGPLYEPNISFVFYNVWTCGEQFGTEMSSLFHYWLGQTEKYMCVKVTLPYLFSQWNLAIYFLFYLDKIFMLNNRTGRSEQRVWTQIKLLLQEQFDLGLHWGHVERGQFT